MRHKNEKMLSKPPVQSANTSNDVCATACWSNRNENRYASGMTAATCATSNAASPTTSSGPLSSGLASGSNTMAAMAGTAVVTRSWVQLATQ